MKKLFFRLVHRIVRWYNETLDQESREEQRELVELIAMDQATISREKSLATKDAVACLRDDADVYHCASLKYLNENPDKDFVDFDQLDRNTKDKYFNA